MKKHLLAALCAFMPSISHAGSQTGTIEYLRVRANDGLIYFGLNGAQKAGSPSCATNSNWIIRDENSNAGKQQYAMLLAAQLAGKTLAVVGMNSCVRWPDAEDAGEIRIVD